MLCAVLSLSILTDKTKTHLVFSLKKTIFTKCITRKIDKINIHLKIVTIFYSIDDLASFRWLVGLIDEANENLTHNKSMENFRFRTRWTHIVN